MQMRRSPLTVGVALGLVGAWAIGRFQVQAQGAKVLFLEKRVGPGDFIRVPGGHKHWSSGDEKEGALFYEESSGKFDFVPVK
jgi:hypothetical protein